MRFQIIYFVSTILPKMKTHSLKHTEINNSATSGKKKNSCISQTIAEYDQLELRPFKYMDPD